ncbi:unnamed protein product, partial [Prorocentrum cordatum]
DSSASSSPSLAPSVIEVGFPPILAHGRATAKASPPAERPSAFLPPPRARRPRCPSEPVAGARSRTVPAARDQSGHDGSAGLVTSIGYSFLHRVVYTAGV